MAKFFVNPEELKKQSNQLDKVARKYIKIGTDLSWLDLSGILTGGYSTISFGKSVNNVLNRYHKAYRNLQLMGNSLETISSTYSGNEKKLVGYFSTGEYEDDLEFGTISSVKDKWGKETSYIKFLTAGGVKSKLDIKGHEIKRYFDPSTGKWTDKKVNKYYDLKNKKWVEEEEPKDAGKKSVGKQIVDNLEIKDVKLLEVGVATPTATYLSDSISNESGTLTGSYKLGDAEAHASSFAGIVGFDENGNKVIRPGVGFDAGASATVLSLDGSAKVGNDNLGVGASANVTVGKAEAKASGKLGIVDGKVNASVKASAEVTLASAEGSVSANVGGVEVKATAGVKVGVGAHADIGISDGKLKCDIGASLGIGVDIKFEIDVSGAVKKAAKAAKNVGKSVCKFFKKIF